MQVVTGATGHAGNALVRYLVTRGEGVRALVGPSGRSASLQGLDVETAEADVRDYRSLVRAFHGAEVVYHVAGIVSIATRGLKRLRFTNVEGTRNVLMACREAGVDRLVYTSSVHALAEPPRGTALDETFALDPDSVRGPYAKTKAEATGLVLAAARKGFNAVVVFPSGIIGPYDFRPSHMGKFMLDCAQSHLKIYVDGAYNFVDVRDVAQGMVAAAEKGCPGEGYVLAGHEVTVADLIHAIELITGVPGPHRRLPFGIVRTAGFLAPPYYRIRGKQPLFTTYSLDVIASNCSMSCEKARRELGFYPRPLQQTLEDTISWFIQAGKLPGRKP